MLLITPPGVYRAQADTEMLIGALDDEPLAPGAAVLDVGTGSGAVAVAAGRRGARVTAVDVSWSALGAALLNGALHGRRIRPRHGDLLSAVRGRRFDVVAANPPYVPCPGDSAPRGAARAWDAGRDGRLLLDRICAQAPAALKPGGVLLLVHSDLCGVDTTCELLRAGGLRTEIVARARQPYGPVMSSRARWFEREGLARPGQCSEELVVIRGARE
ncbi:HemK2/MTQ2 family protein methyltransferase [Streptacidiphilus neutrinimicus]|uniref:HemK2/MTQ2 family protein methyltransferase n=1 Tax=Streptacidiphilus neutrinimicus TaxID=105420 RepID=UPI0005A8166B|nr:HemK2/MTQ2 family protein methyltransferase [Streptacidiphilus neutrinimicus]